MGKKSEFDPSPCFPPATCCVNLGKPLDSSEPYFLICGKGLIIPTTWVMVFITWENIMASATDQEMSWNSRRGFPPWDFLPESEWFWEREVPCPVTTPGWAAPAPWRLAHASPHRSGGTMHTCRLYKYGLNFNKDSAGLLFTVMCNDPGLPLSLGGCRTGFAFGAWLKGSSSWS